MPSCCLIHLASKAFDLQHGRMDSNHMGGCLNWLNFARKALFERKRLFGLICMTYRHIAMMPDAHN